MEKKYGNYLGICIDNNDPEERGRVKIYFSSIGPFIEGWSKDGENKEFDCVGDNLMAGLTKDVVDTLKKVLPWAEAAAPVFGGSAKGSYNANTGEYREPSAPAMGIDATGKLFGGNKQYEQYALDAVREYNLAGLPLSDAEAQKWFGGKPSEEGYAALLSAIANRETDFRTETGNTSDPGGSFGLYQMSPLDDLKGGRNGKYTAQQLKDDPQLNTRLAAAKLAMFLNKDQTITSNRGGGKDYWSTLRPGWSSPSKGNVQNMIAEVRAGTAQLTEAKGNNEVAKNPDASALSPSTSVFGNPFGTPAKINQAPPAAGDSISIANNTSPSLSSVEGYQPDPTSSKNIATLNPAAQEAAQNFLKRANEVAGQQGYSVKIISGTRTYEEQDRLYAQGRSQAGNIVTNAKGGQSNHNFGIAFDVGVFKNGKYIEESPVYAQLGEIGTAAGLEWGGNWASIKDEPHFQLNTGLTTTQLAAKVAAGELTLPEITPSAKFQTNTVKNTTGTQITPIDTTGQASGMFNVPAPGAMLWAFFREGDPLYPVYFAASYGSKEWGSAYQKGTPGVNIPGSEKDAPNTNMSGLYSAAGGLRNIDTVDQKTGEDFRQVNLFHASGAHLAHHNDHTALYHPNELMVRSDGNQYNYCLNRETWTQGTKNDVTMGDHHVIIGNASAEVFETVASLQEKINQINEEMLA